MRKTLKKILTLVLSAAVLLSTLMCAIPVTAATADRNTDFMVGNYGIMVHYLHEKDEVQAAVDSFDADAFAKQVNNAGAKWVLFTLTQSNGVYNIPMDAHLDANGEAIFADTDVTVAEGEKDIVEKLYDALTPYGVKLMLYWIPGAPAGADEATVALAEKLGAAERSGTSATSDWKMNDTVAANMSAIMKSVSEKYGNKIAGWWIDACYDSTGFNSTYAAEEAAALRAGNANAVVAFNRGTQQHDAYYDVESYAAGEICHVNRTDPTKDNYEDVYMFSADSRWTEKHFQSHYLTFLGSGWTMGDERYETAELVDHIYNNILKDGGAMTLDMCCTDNGTLDPQQLNQVIALSKLANKVETELSVDFEEYNPFGWVDNVLDDKEDRYTNDGAYVQVATGEDALNGSTSLRVIPKEDNSRTDIVGAATVPTTDNESGITFDRINFDGNPDFDKADVANGFDKVSGIMMRIKLENDTTETAHKLAVYTQQSGYKESTVLGNGAILYDLQGNKVTASTGNLRVSVPAGFDGFVFLPFATAQSVQVTVAGSYDSYATYPGNLIDYSKSFKLQIRLNDATWNGTSVLIDDINFYYGNTDADAWNTMRALGYDVLLSEQPEVYTLPIDSENFEQPISGAKATSGASTSWKLFDNTATITNDAEEVLNGNYSIKISTINSSYSAAPTYLKLTTNPFNVSGISELSTEKIKAAASDSYAYFKVRIKLPATNDKIKLIPAVSQNGSYWTFPRNAKGYNVDGTVNSNVTSTYDALVMPAGFDGYLYIPVYSSMETATFRTNDCAITNGNNYAYKNSELTPPSLDEDFELFFQFIRSSGTDLDNTNIYLDDIDVIINDGELPETFENPVELFPGLNNIYDSVEHPTTTGVNFVTGDEALNGNGSVKFTLPEGNTETRVQAVALAGNPDYTADDYSKVTGIMFRMKADSKMTAQSLFTIQITQDGVMTQIGRGAELYSVDGTYIGAANADYWGSYIPVGFDGFVFIPFSRIQTAGAAAPDYTASYKFAPRFYDDSWSGTTVYMDDISYYSTADGTLTVEEARNIIRGLGYTIYKAEQPATYELPLDFEGYEIPFGTITSHYGKVTSESGAVSWPTVKGSAELATGDEALDGDVSLKITFPTDSTITSSYVRGSTSTSAVAGIAGLDKETLAQANKDFAYLKVRVKTPDTKEKYTFRVELSQTGLSYHTFLASGAYAIDDDGYYYAISSLDLDCFLPRGFEGDVYFPVSRAMAYITDSQRASYANGAENMVDLTEDFNMNLYFYGSNIAGQTFIFDNMSMVVNKLGDINGDNLANSDDLVIMKKQLLGVDTSYEKKCDIKEDSVVDVLDFIRLKKIISK